MPKSTTILMIEIRLFHNEAVECILNEKMQNLYLIKK